MKTLTCLIVDDEPDAHTVLQTFCNRIGFVAIKASFHHALDALEFFKGGGDVDFIFLDINMPQVSGFDLLTLLQPQPKIIFTTAYKEHALQSFEHNVTDYLLKPIPFHRFLKAVNKVAAEVAEKSKPVDPFILFDGLEKPLEASLILYAESGGNYVKLHTASKTLLVHATMQTVSNRLEEQGFIRIHKQYTVPLAGIEKYFVGTVVLNCGKELPVGISYRQYVAGLLAGKYNQ